MRGHKTTRAVLLACTAVLALSAAACGSGGADSVASPGEGGFPPPPPPTQPPTQPPVTTTPGGAALDCPTGFANLGTVTGTALATIAGTTSVTTGEVRVCQVPNTLTGNQIVPFSTNGRRAYQITGRVDVGQDQGGDAAAPRAGAASGTLTIEPGVTLFGSSGLDYVVVNRGSRMNAVGSVARPIVFTSRADITNTQADPANAIGEWGGLVILGRAPINNCPGSTAPGTPSCEAQVEGTNAFFGGNAVADSSGQLNYVRVQHSGFRILENNELNGITLAGVGAGTNIDFVQVHNSSDDGIEWFGGTVNAKHLVLTGNDDDSLDTDQGYNGVNQFIIAVQRAGGGDRIVEASNVGGAVRTPISNPRFVNFTFVGRPNGGDAIILNSATNAGFFNGVVTGSAACLDVDDAGTTATFGSVLFSSCIIPFRNDTATRGAADAEAIFAAGSNNIFLGVGSTLQNIFINGANESTPPRVPVANLTAISSFLTQVNYIGAVRDAQDTWYAGWTCGLPGQPAC